MPYPDSNASKAHTDILARLAAHLDDLAGRVAILEEAVGERMGASKAASDDLITQLQSLDFIRQSLEDCAMLSLALQNGPAPIALGDTDKKGLAQKLRLESTRALLNPKKAPLIYPLQEDLGDVDLF